MAIWFLTVCFCLKHCNHVMFVTHSHSGKMDLIKTVQSSRNFMCWTLQNFGWNKLHGVLSLGIMNTSAPDDKISFGLPSSHTVHLNEKHGQTMILVVHVAFFGKVFWELIVSFLHCTFKLENTGQLMTLVHAHQILIQSFFLETLSWDCLLEFPSWSGSTSSHVRVLHDQLCSWNEKLVMWWVMTMHATNDSLMNCGLTKSSKTKLFMCTLHWRLLWQKQPWNASLLRTFKLLDMDQQHKSGRTDGTVWFTAFATSTSFGFKSILLWNNNKGSTKLSGVNLSICQLHAHPKSHAMCKRPGDFHH